MEFNQSTRLVVVTNVLEDKNIKTEFRYRSGNLSDSHSRDNDKRGWLFEKFPNTPIIIYKKPTEVPKEGYEASAYLKFFYDNYDNLPQSMLCLHGHKKDWHQYENDIFLNIVRDMEISETYFNITDLYIDDRIIGPNLVVNKLNDLWDDYFRPYFNTDCPTYLSHLCCAQFLVKRSAVHLRPREAYKVWYELSITKDNNKLIAQVFEYIWHTIFGEPYVVKYEDIKNKFEEHKEEYSKLLIPKIYSVNGG